eukprot:9482175-Pyramimonas_sp.AAC.2
MNSIACLPSRRPHRAAGGRGDAWAAAQIDSDRRARWAREQLNRKCASKRDQICENVSTFAELSPGAASRVLTGLVDGVSHGSQELLGHQPPVIDPSLLSDVHVAEVGDESVKRAPNAPAAAAAAGRAERETDRTDRARVMR